MLLKKLKKDSLLDAFKHILKHYAVRKVLETQLFQALEILKSYHQSHPLDGGPQWYS